MAVLASAGAAGTGTPSGPLGPGEGSGFSVPSVLSEASLSFGVPPAALAGLPLLLVTARVMATAAMITTTAAPIPASQLRRRLRAASRARISATLARAEAPRALASRALAPARLAPAGLAPARPSPARLGRAGLSAAAAWAPPVLPPPAAPPWAPPLFPAWAPLWPACTIRPGLRRLGLRRWPAPGWPLPAGPRRTWPRRRPPRRGSRPRLSRRPSRCYLSRPVPSVPCPRSLWTRDLLLCPVRSP